MVHKLWFRSIKATPGQAKRLDLWVGARETAPLNAKDLGPLSSSYRYRYPELPYGLDTETTAHGRAYQAEMVFCVYRLTPRRRLPDGRRLRALAWPSRVPIARPVQGTNRKVPHKSYLIRWDYSMPCVTSTYSRTNITDFRSAIPLLQPPCRACLLMSILTNQVKSNAR